MLRGGTLFSGIGTPEVACPEIDWRWCAEIDPFACAVLKQRFPHVPNLGDVEKVNWDAVEPVDLIVFGSPCQSFSVAGKRLGLDDPRGNLALVALAVVARLRPRWFVFENVPGLLSSDGGRDFGIFLGSVGELGYGWAYRTLDAQYFGVPQRRRRLFVVGHSGGDWRLAAAVLFEPESLSRDPPPSREEGQRVAPTVEARADAGGAGWGTDFLAGGGIATTLRGRDLAKGVDSDATDTLISGAVTAKWHKGGGPAGDERYNLVAYDVTGALATNGGRETDIHTALRSRAPGHSEASTTTVIAIPLLEVGARTNGDGYRDGDGIGGTDDPMFTLQGGKQHGIAIPVQNATRGKSQNGLGIGGEAMFTLDGASQLAIAFRENTRAEVKFVEGDIAQSLTSGGGKPGQGFPAVAVADPISANEARTYTHEGSNNFRLRNCVAAPLGAGDGTRGWRNDLDQGAFIPAPMSFTERTRADGRNLEAQEDLAYALCNPGSGGRTHSRQILAPNGFDYADTDEANAVALLRALRDATDEETLGRWGLGVIAAFWPQEVLRSEVHGCCIRCTAQPKRGLVNVALSCAKTGSGWSLRDLWEAGCDGCPPQGWQPSKQLAEQLGAYLSQLPYSPSPAQRFLRPLWQAAEGLGLLQHALFAVQNARRSARGERQPVRSGTSRQRTESDAEMRGDGVSSPASREGILRTPRATGETRTPSLAVRRLLVEECEALQGLPRGFSNITYRGKPAADGPRYRALGNAMAAPVVRWILKRIQGADA